MLVLWAVIVFLRLPIPRDGRTWFAFLIMGLANNVVPFGLLTWGQQYIETGLTSILNGATAIFGVVIAAIVFADEKLTLPKGIGVLLGFAGVILTVGPKSLGQFDLKSTAQIAVLGAAFSYGAAGSWARARLGHLAPQVAAAGMVTGSTLILLPAALLIDGPVVFDLNPITWIAIAYYALFATAGAYLLYYRVLAMAGSANLMLVTLIIPPVAIFLGVVVLDEALSPQVFGGFALLALGLLILNGTIRLPFLRP